MISYHSEISANVVEFCRLLRNEGLNAGFSEEADVLRALQLIQIGNPEEFKFTLRTILARKKSEQEVFDLVFESYWHGKISTRSTHLGLRKKPSFKTPKQSVLNPNLANWNDAIEDHEQQILTYSPLEILTRKNFSNFKNEDIQETTRQIVRLKHVLKTSRGLRYRKSMHRHLLDFRKTMRLSMKNAGEVLQLEYKERSPKPLNILLLCDVSGSMETYSNFLISFMYSFHSVYHKIETFVFSTSLTRLTGIMKRKSLKDVLQEISNSVPNWSGGTRIGESFQHLLELYPHKISNDTVVIILSDGWDIGKIDLLEQSMKTIHRKAKRVIWLNPLMNDAQYAPECLGMQCALPYIDDFLPAQDLESLRNLCNHLANNKLLRRKVS
ncbi:MAG TPA: VWA domain-containing protein [Acidobacteriota bacterium]|nr:VWA domain-containing protein [Acidobacteriota bacterium]